MTSGQVVRFFFFVGESHVEKNNHKKTIMLKTQGELYL